MQALPAVRCAPQAKSSDHVVADAAAVQIVQRLCALRRIERSIVKFRRLHQRRVEAVAVFLGRGVLASGFRDGHVRPLGQMAHGLGELHALHAHDKGDDVPARVAAEAIVHLLFLVHGKRWGLFAVKRTQTPVLGTLARQRHIFRYDRYDLRPVAHLVDPFAGKPACHCTLRSKFRTSISQIDR